MFLFLRQMRLALILAVSVQPLMACSRLFPVTPQPGRELLRKCPKPILVADPEKPQPGEIETERVNVAAWGGCNETRYEGLSDWVEKNLFTK